MALYSWTLFGSDSISPVLTVNQEAAIAAGVAVLYGIVSYLFAPHKHMIVTAIIGYYIVLVMIALLIKTTADFGSPFIALWMLAGLFAAVFGVYGIAAITLGTVSFLTILTVDKQLNFDVIALAVIFTVLPLIISYMIWRPSSRNQADMTTDDHSLAVLTSQLNAASGQSEIVLAAITDGVISINHKGIIELINPAAQHMLGWGRADAVGLDYKLVLKMYDSHNNSPNELNDPVQQSLTNHTQTKSEAFHLQVADTGQTFVASIVTTPIGERKNGAIIVFRDITHENEEDRQRAEFISTASHEMRTPVAGIEGYLGLALNPATASIDDKAREYIGKAQEAAKHLGRLFQDLLDVTRADDGRLQNTPCIVELIPFVHDIIVGQLPAARAKGLTIQYPPQPDTFAETTVVDEEKDGPSKTIGPVLYVNVDKDHLREIVSNLVENAIKYTPSGTITVDLSSDSEAIIISIKDSGIGIPKEDQAHLFQKFYRVDNSATREIGGTGLGLYLARRLSEAIGGSLWVESVYGEGSTFFLKLPRVKSIDAEKILAEQQAAAHRPKMAQPAAARPASLAQVTQQSLLQQQQVAAPVAPPVTAAQPAPQPPAAQTPPPVVIAAPAQTPASAQPQPQPQTIQVRYQQQVQQPLQQQQTIPLTAQPVQQPINTSAITNNNVE
ncbi:PAS domain-containing protein [Candidatus Saccharibacteria bacterium]|nr:PAS domain-containing protein [Candidatus Saccharibacteria bacterium]